MQQQAPLSIGLALLEIGDPPALSRETVARRGELDAVWIEPGLNFDEALKHLDAREVLARLAQEARKLRLRGWGFRVVVEILRRED